MYRVIDYYGGEEEVIGVVDSYDEAAELATLREIETDGECDIEIIQE